jgi:hypothetical protein
LNIILNKPLYVEICILDISEICLHGFQYDYLLSNFDDDCKIMYTDIDSLIYEVKYDNAYGVMKHDIHRFGTSDYAEGNPYNVLQVNKKAS